MRTYHLDEKTTATPQQVLDAITDFGPGRQQIFGNSADKFLQVHELGADHADVTEGTGKGDKPVSWERLAYDWSDPGRVTMKVLDSNIFSTKSGHTYTITAQPDGTTDVDVVVEREGKNFKGRLLALAVSTIAKPSLAKALRNTLRAVEARSRADERELVAA
jgi:polyketide cyclase/dehydrase/lipid transport protein